MCACESMCVHESKQKQTRESFEEDQLYVCDGFGHASVCVCVCVCVCIKASANTDVLFLLK